MIERAPLSGDQVRSGVAAGCCCLWRRARARAEAGLRALVRSWPGRDGRISCVPDGRACSAFYPVALRGRQAGRRRVLCGACVGAASRTLTLVGCRRARVRANGGMPLVSARTRDLTHTRSGLELEGRTTT